MMSSFSLLGRCYFLKQLATISLNIKDKAAKKAGAMYHQGIKRVYLAWTTEWRMKHKKVRVEDVQKRLTKKNVKVRKAIVGMSLDEIKRKRGEDRATRDKVIAESEKKVKEARAKDVAARKANKAKTQSKAAPIAKAAPKAKKLTNVVRK